MADDALGVLYPHGIRPIIDHRTDFGDGGTLVVDHGHGGSPFPMVAGARATAVEPWA
ncbi:hypothetical protein [Ensifer sp. Root142]|uniref:hypothetical protein n=1 Tax=Ensifer TaxID=106591 RepID=UPI000B00E2B8|nr:hypothetical protein [Ensifer sp. Root142]